MSEKQTARSKQSAREATESEKAKKRRVVSFKVGGWAVVSAEAHPGPPRGHERADGVDGRGAEGNLRGEEARAVAHLCHGGGGRDERRDHA